MDTKIRILAILFILWGCSDFLEESSQDEVRPSTVADLEQLLLGEAYTAESSGNYNIYYSTEIYTDDYQSNGLVNLKQLDDHNAKKWLYTWDPNMFTNEGYGYDENLWRGPYKYILGCNLILDYLDEMSGSTTLRESIRGEALVLRAWYYLHLVNFFGIAYNQGDPDRDLGVPLKLDATVTGEYFKRNTVGEIYDQIEQDLLEGDRLLTKYDYNRNFYRIGHLAAKSILSRMYLYMEEWDKALEYADNVLQKKSSLLDLNVLPTPAFGWLFFSSTNIIGPYNTDHSDEIIWIRNNPKISFEIYSGFMEAVTEGPYTISDDLFRIYENGTPGNVIAKTIWDMRGFFYFLLNGITNSSGNTPLYDGYRVTQTSKAIGDVGNFQGIRAAELYLNRAEAYIQKYINTGNDSYRQAALVDLNTLRCHRYNDDFPYKEVNITNGEELLEFCRDERRRELVGETNHRWCDLRRYGKVVTHVLMETGKPEYTKDMSRYALPIPEFVMLLNPELVQN